MRCRTRTGTPSSTSSAISAFSPTIFIVLAVYQLYLNQWLQIRWRRWLTAAYLDHWLAGANHYRMQLLGDAADNPDQRIAEDIAHSSQLTLNIGLQLLNSLRDAALVHDHPVGAVGRGAAASVRDAFQYSRLSAVGGIDLRHASAPRSRI